MFAALLIVMTLISDPIARDASASQCFEKILKDSGYGFRSDERAAFLVLRDDGAYDCVSWPSTNRIKSASWSGSIPERAVAIAHTHPRREPMPSAHDNAEAKRLGMPIYVVTPGEVWRTGSGVPLFQSSKR
jgi:hypothetical protein